MDRAGGSHWLTATLDAILKVLVTATLLCIAVITFIDVIGRYFLSAPVPGAFEIQEFGMGILIFAGLPLVTRSRDHITVSLFDGVFQRNATLNRIKTTLVYLVSAGILLFVAYALYVQSIGMKNWGTSSAFLELPYFPVAWFMTAMSVIAGLVMFGFAFLSVIGRLDNELKGEGRSIL
ncbi:TRAP transporter small permease [Pseudooceanicola sp. MF1-13]|uniref:TRAP transporter small permease n=1 Tax=Pseudooceanicola sp. MF1-13 TaxID=3379095 RepID=UPI0038925324